MNYVIAKVRGNTNTFEKLCACENLYELPTELCGAVDYHPETILDEYEWFKLDHFSNTTYIIDEMKQSFNSTNYSAASRVRTEKIEYIMAVQDDIYFFQRILKHSIMINKRITLGDKIRLDQGEKSIVINSLPDAIYDKKYDILYFKKLSMISPIFNGIDQLFREATNEETESFLKNEFIKLENDYGVNKVKKSNRKRIVAAIDTLANFSKEDKEDILSYIHEYYPLLKYEADDKVFTISNEEELKYLLWGIEQRYYTTPVTHEQRIANSIIKL